MIDEYEATKRHGREQIVRKLRDADAMLNVGKDQWRQRRVIVEPGTRRADAHRDLQL